MIVHFSRATPAACGEPDPFSVTIYTDEVNCPKCQAMITARYGIRFTAPRKKKDPQKQLSI